MARACGSVVLLLGLVGTAVAEAPREDEPRIEPAPAAALRREPAYAFAVNAPISWIGARSLGASFYAGLSRRHALRANVASYERAPGVWAELIVLAAGEEPEATYDGRTTDAGIGWVFYPRRLFSGPMLEAGALFRHRDHSVRDRYAEPVLVHTQTRALGVRGLVGWSWAIGSGGFVALAVGGSLTRETGEEYTEAFDIDPVGAMTTDVRRTRAQLEGLLRLGWTFAP